jgi:hypothetical protein
MFHQDLSSTMDQFFKSILSLVLVKKVFGFDKSLLMQNDVRT